ncbi:aaa family atpase [Ophiostoma piceae UAMH 11346]|uniref:Aaa family atpase n=1 Tax=Ophiostoma piceae (strain UAMH 11346) TaxID=1262450 RepID=S3CYV7_OPHP1|nr:aaa family atpase [Ophiostoma piceae UAMH 11346]
MESTSGTEKVEARPAKNQAVQPDSTSEDNASGSEESRSRGGRSRATGRSPPGTVSGDLSPTARKSSPTSWKSSPTSRKSSPRSRKSSPTGQSNSPWQILHRTGRHLHRSAPHWEELRRNAQWRATFVGSSYTLEALLERNPDLLFVIINDYPDIVSDLTGNETVQGKPRATTMRITSSSLVLALTKLAKQVPSFAKAFPKKGIFEKGIEEPYHCFYVMFRDWNFDVTGLTEKMQDQLMELRNYLRLAHLPLYKTASELISQGKVSEATMPFLVSPGTVLVKKTRSATVCFTATTWPRLKVSYIIMRPASHGSLITDSSPYSGSRTSWHSGSDSDSNAGSDHSEAPRSRLLAAQSHATHDGSDARQWEIDVKTLKFRTSGHLTSAPGTINLTRPIEGPHGQTLDIPGQFYVYPLQMASAEIQELIDKRSRKFFQCLKTLYAELETTHEAGSSQKRKRGRYIVDFTMVDKSKSKKSDDAAMLVKQWSDLAAYPEDQSLYVCPPLISAYNMQSKHWNLIELDRIQPVRWNKLAFRRLAIPSTTKDVIQALVTKQLSHDKSTDFISSKGNGLLMLLHGGPGTGKTVTAVFLRMLEYNDAIVILTSNRVGDFDEAFKSRIQLAIRYNDLDEWQREKIWHNFFEHIGEVSPEEIDLIELKACIPELKKHKINGRQIRNVVTTARQLAQFHNKTFGQEELEKAIKVSSEFDKYLDDVRRAKEDDEIRKSKNPDSAWARDSGIR